MAQNAVDILLLFTQATIVNPIPPEDSFWIDNLGNKIITNNGDFIVFKPGP